MDKRAIVFDFNRTLHDPDADALYDGVLEMLDVLRAERRLFLLSKKEKGREGRLRELGIAGHFEDVLFVERKTSELLAEMLAKGNLNPTQVVVVGDRARGELHVANSLGSETVWFRQGKFAHETPDSYEPTHTVRTLSELHGLLKRIPVK